MFGPFLYTIYTLPLGDILRDSGISYHLYADDSQLYLSFDVRDQLDFSETLHKMQCCVSRVKSWMLAHKLKLNDDKTEVLVLSSPHFRNSLIIPDFQVETTSVVPSSAVRNIGVIFDSSLSMKQQISSICKVAHFHLRNIGCIRKFITQEACEKLIHAFITSRLDYGNALLYGVPDTQLKRLQRILHIAARIVTLTPTSHHITPVLESLHWLPIQQRIKYKILLLTFRALHGLAPTYLADLVVPYVPHRTLRSDGQRLLTIPKTYLKTFGDKAFSSVAPTLWNSLPVHIRLIDKLSIFKSQIKTILYTEAY